MYHHLCQGFFISRWPEARPGRFRWALAGAQASVASEDSLELGTTWNPKKIDQRKRSKDNLLGLYPQALDEKSEKG